ncbi:MAG: RloB family protein, partial [Burkholderiaceae bacterium]
MRMHKVRSSLLATERAKAERKVSGRSASSSALIVCEGEFTEPFYLRGLLAYLNINSASVEVISGQTRSNAVAVVKRARDRFQQIPRDRVFTVIDGEQADLSRALHHCKTPLQRANARRGEPEIC